MFRKIFLVLLLVFTILFIPNVYAVEDDIYDNIRISIDDYDELSSVQGWNYYTGEEITNFDDFFIFEDDELTILKKANYEISSSLYGLEVKQDTADLIGIVIWNDGDLLIENLKAHGYSITANGELEIKNSAIYLEGHDYYSEGSINSEDDIIIDNSIITCENTYGFVESTNNTATGNIHSYYGDIFIKNNSDIYAEGRIYTEEGSITISDSKVVLDDEWGYMEAPNDIKFSNSEVSFLFGIQGGENIEIIDSTINALNKESIYAKQFNDHNQGWIQSSSGAMTIKNSIVNVINSITSGADMMVEDSTVTLSGSYSNNGYLQSGNGNLSILNSSVNADKDVYALNDLTVKNSSVIITGNNSKKGYLEAHDGKMIIDKSHIEVDEGIVSDKNTNYINSEIIVVGKNSNRGYVQVFNGDLEVSGGSLKIDEKATIHGKTTFNNTTVSLSSGIVTNGLDIIDSKFYASNKNTTLELSSYSPVISLGKFLIKNSEFVSESITDVPSIASLGEITVIDNGFINKNNDALKIIVVDADSTNFILGKNAEYIHDGNKVYTTSFNNRISNYSTLKLSIVNPETISGIVFVLTIVGIVIGGIYLAYRKKCIE
ncbi:MAG: hypothetical protein IJ842_04055 [Bacilli bacterium]|nr:hypothetical protein [Bacilli bacterium]